MATVDGLTKERMLAIEAESITNARLDSVTNHLILTTHGGTDIDVGDVQGVQGPPGPLNPNALDLSATGLQVMSGPLEVPSVEANLSGVMGRYVGAHNGAPTYASPQNGDFANDPTNQCFWLYNGTSWNAVGKDDVNRHNISAKYYRNAAYTMVGAWTITVIPFDTKVWDPHDFGVGAGNAMSAAGVFTCPIAGRYLVNAQVMATSSATGQNAQIFIGQTGSAGITSGNGIGGNSTASGQQIAAQTTTVLNCAAGDTITAYYDVGVALAMQVGQRYFTSIDINWISH